MGGPTVAAAEMLPRFLLPRLSWGAPVSVSQATRPFASIPSPDQRRSFASFQAGPVTQRPYSRNISPITKRAFHATALRQRDHHFDTLKFVKRLQGEGFTEEQSVAMMKTLNDVIEERYVSSFYNTHNDNTNTTLKHPKPHPNNGPPRGRRQSNVHSEGRFCQAALRASLCRLHRIQHNTNRARAIDKRYCQAEQPPPR